MSTIAYISEPASELERLIADLSESGLLVFVFGAGVGWCAGLRPGCRAGFAFSGVRVGALRAGWSGHGGEGAQAGEDFGEQAVAGCSRRISWPAWRTSRAGC